MVAHTVATPAVAGEAEPHSEAWHALRRLGLGSSDAAAACGVSPWRTRYELYLQKVALPGAMPPTMEERRMPEEPRLYWGIKHEPMILQEFCDRTGRRVARPRATFRSEQYPFMLANLDGLTDDAVVEAKTADSADEWGEVGSDEIPLSYMLQVQHAMVVTGRLLAYVPVLIRGWDFRIYEVPADRTLQEHLIAEERAFWEDHVQRQEPPAIETLEDARRRWGGLLVRGPVLATEEDAKRVARLHAIAALLEQLEAENDGHKLALMERIGEEGDTLVDSRGQPLVTWKLAKGPQRFDVEAFTAEHPELAPAYMRTGKANRRFLLKQRRTP